MRVLFALALLAACKREPVTVKKDPTPPVDAAPTPTVASSRVSLHGRIVEARTGEVVFPLRPNKVREEATDDRAAYVLYDDAELHAFELATGKTLWSRKTASRVLTTTKTYVVLIEGSEVVVVTKSDGVARKLTTTVAIDEVLGVDDHAVLRSGSELIILDLAALATSGRYTAKGALEGRANEYSRALLPIAGGFCFAQHSPPDYEVRCHGPTGVETMHAVVTLAKPTDPPYSRFSLIAASRHHVMLGSVSFGVGSRPRRAVVVRLSDGKEVARIEDELTDFIEDASGALAGLIAAEPEVRFYAPSGKLEWSHKPKWPEHFAVAVASGDRLIVARHNIIATGVDVLGLNKRDGSLLWTGETKLPPIAHSKYHNRVELELRADAVILRGHESSVEHVHVYEAATGKLRFHDP